MCYLYLSILDSPQRPKQKHNINREVKKNNLEKLILDLVIMLATFTDGSFIE